jgi:Fe-S cluster biogenesis protein NfuA/nitrite reductase/ring-hydroxylating ferredoxin subunit
MPHNNNHSQNGVPHTAAKSNGTHVRPLDDLNERGRRIQQLVEKIDAVPDPVARALLQECMELTLAFYGSGLERMLLIVKDLGLDGQRAYEKLINDNIVRGLLLIHGLHPLSLESRLRQALDKVRPYMESHGGNVEVISLDNEVARLRLNGACKGCPSSAVTMELAIRQAIEEACPDLQGFEVEGAIETDENALEHKPYAAPEWTLIENASTLQNGTLMQVHAGDTPLILCRLEDRFYAYRDHCPACNMPLHLGILDGGLLICSLGHQYDARHAGRCPTNPGLHLDPVPLLAGEDGVRVALARRQEKEFAVDATETLQL